METAPLVDPDTDRNSCAEPTSGETAASSSTTFLVVLSTFVAVCGSFAFGNAVGYSSLAEAGIVDELGLTTAEYSVFSSLLTVGAMISAAISGRVADLIGRRGTMGISEMFCIAGWLAILFTNDYFWLDLGRFLVGCGIGLLSYVVPVYVAEITSKTVRGSFTSLDQLMISLGRAFTFFIGSLVDWRALAVIGIVPCLLQLLGLVIIPESPRWLAKVGRIRESEAALQQLRGKKADISQEATDIEEFTEHLNEISEGGTLELFQWQYLHSIIVGVGLMVFKQFGGLSSFAFYASTIFDSAGFSSTIGSIAVAVVQVISGFFSMLLIDKSGRRLLLILSSVGACLGCVLTALSFFCQDLHLWKQLTPVLALLGVLLYVGSSAIGLAGIPWIIMSEIFPINIKGTAGSLVNLVSWIGSWVIASTFNFLFEWNSAGTFLIYAAITGAGIVFIAKLVPETKGRTLEEIQASITKNRQEEGVVI